MSPHPRTGLLDRRVQLRDARLFVIAVEGARVGAEYTYFTELEALGLLDRQRVKLVLLPADPVSNDSAPRHVLDRLDQYATRYRLRPDLDQRWLVLDRDRWPDRQLSEVAQDARQAGLGVALSNPCFELWLILHASADLAFLADVDGAKRSKACKAHLGSLHTRGECLKPTLATLWHARDAAAELDVDPTTRWPLTPGSRVYRLVDALAEAGALRR